MTSLLGQVLSVVALAGAVLLWPSPRRPSPANRGPGDARPDGRDSRPHRSRGRWSGRRWSGRRLSGRRWSLRGWSGRRPRDSSFSAAVPHVPVAVVIELVAAALSAGLPPVDAVDATTRAIGDDAAEQLRPVVGALRLGAATEVAWARAGPGYQPLVRALVLAERTGASTATALRRTASDERSARRRRAQVAARRLAVQLVLPLGLATLPAFALLAVVPVLIGLALQVVAS